jgi:hypothetical protein
VEAELVAFHGALVRRLRETGRSGQLIPTGEWESIMVRALGVATRQSGADKTWAMDRRRLIQHVKGKGVIVLEHPGELSLWKPDTPPKPSSTTA